MISSVCPSKGDSKNQVYLLRGATHVDNLFTNIYNAELFLSNDKLLSPVVKTKSLNVYFSLNSVRGKRVNF